MSPPDYSSARLRPRSAGLRFARCAHLTNRPIQLRSSSGSNTTFLLLPKRLYRSRGMATTGTGAYQVKQREHWLMQLTEVGMRQRAAWLYQQLDHVRELRKQAKAAVLAEGQRHRAVELLRTIPQVGPVRAAQIVATAGTPHRFRTKRQFWSYSGLAVVTHTSAEYELRAGRVVRRNKPGQRGD